MPVPGRVLQLAALAVILSVGYGLISLAARRLGRDPRGLGLGFAALLAWPIFLQAARQNLGWSGAFVSARPVLLGLVGVYTVLALVVLVWGGARRTLWASALLIMGVVAVRVGMTNAFENHVMERASTSAGSGPPVLLIVLDTFRADAIDLARGADSATPNLARFASEADVYTHAISNASWTLPGHASIFTGQPLSRHRTDFTAVPGFHASLPTSLPTMHQIFGANGYQTACVAANVALAPATGLLRGCQQSCHPGREWIVSSLPIRLGRLVLKGITWLVVEVGGLHLSGDACEIVDQAIEEIQGDPHPLYVFLNFMDVHPPYRTTRDMPFLARLAYRGELFRLLVGRLAFEDFARHQAHAWLASYRTGVGDLDREVGRLFDTLRQRGWYDKTLIVVTADHGHAFWENTNRKSYFGHHGAYEPVVRIPLMVKHPGQREGALFDHYVQQACILPAVLKTVGLPAPPGLASGGLEVDAPRGAIVTEWYPMIRGDRHFLPWTRFGIYKDHYKFVVEDKSHESLFDFDQGRYESVDVIDREPQLAGELRAQLAAVLEQAAQAQAGSDEPNPEVEEQLRALGYVN
jgi:arylsulfatase A-like enzyme